MAEEPTRIDQSFTAELASRFARLAMAGLDQEYPHKTSVVYGESAAIRTPRQLHPAFYGCFDWHSAVHAHWMLVRLLKCFPKGLPAEEIRSRLSTHLTVQNIQYEADCIAEPHNQSFERMYGWAWALRLVAELRSWDDATAQSWLVGLRPLEKILVQRTLDYLPKLTWPIRSGVHQDSGFALSQILDYARLANNRELSALIIARGRAFYEGDRDYAVTFEPSGEDFFSSGLNEADLMRRVLGPAEFANWLEHFFPTLRHGRLGHLLDPVAVDDETDGKLVHLAGLNLSRAWTLRGIASGLPADDSRSITLQQASRAHLTAGLKFVGSGHYEGDHWLATFAVYALSDVGLGDVGLGDSLP